MRPSAFVTHDSNHTNLPELNELLTLGHAPAVSAMSCTVDRGAALGNPFPQGRSIVILDDREQASLAQHAFVLWFADDPKYTQLPALNSLLYEAGP
jgi:hypothetical protein